MSKINEILETQDKHIEKLAEKLPTPAGTERILHREPEIPKEIQRSIPAQAIGKGRGR